MTTALFVTNRGSVHCDLDAEHAPKTVANFVDLATGKKSWTDPRDGANKDERSTRARSSTGSSMAS